MQKKALVVIDLQNDITKITEILSEMSTGLLTGRSGMNFGSFTFSITICPRGQGYSSRVHMARSWYRR